jgi:hypothetical protein
VVSSVVDDLRSNTLTNTVGMVAGGVGEGVNAAIAAKSDGFKKCWTKDSTRSH